MNIKDFIHYYINSEARYRLRYVDSEDGQWSVWLTITPTRLAQLDDLSIEKVEYALRRLEDMTEAEALHIGKLAFFDRDMKYPDSDYRVKKTGITIELPSAYAVSINNDWYEREIRIGFNTGNIWNAPDQHIYERIYNQPAIFHYLLKQGFDLFNLIDAGLAIDIKTLKK